MKRLVEIDDRLPLNRIGVARTVDADEYYCLKVQGTTIVYCCGVVYYPRPNGSSDAIWISQQMSLLLNTKPGDWVELEKVTLQPNANDETTIELTLEKPTIGTQQTVIAQYSFDTAANKTQFPRVLRERKINLSKLIQRQLQGVVIVPEGVATIDILGELYLCRFRSTLPICVLSSRVPIVTKLKDGDATTPRRRERFVTSCLHQPAQQVLKAVEWMTLQPAAPASFGGGLIQGCHGSGKSTLLRYLLSLATTRTKDDYGCVVIDGILLRAEQTTSKINDRLSDIFSNCQANSTNLVLIDDLDILCGGSVGVGAHLLGLVERSTKRCVVFGTVTAFDNLGPSWSKTNRLEQKLSLVPPTQEQRSDFLYRFLYAIVPESDAKAFAHHLASITGGYLPCDLIRICRTALVASPEPNLADFINAKRQVQPSQLTNVDVRTPALTTNWTDFGGYHELRSRLENLVRWRFGREETIERLGVHSVSGILLCGPHGVGKTFLAKILAAECNANFVPIKSSELVSKYMGETERSIRTMFARARAAAPCILFFDELDGLAHKREFSAAESLSSGDGGVYTRILSTLLNEMDGVENNNAGVLVLAACTRAEALDPALIRPGRIDQILTIDLPTIAERQEILNVHTKSTPVDRNVNFIELAAKTEGFTASMLASVCNEAAIRAIRDDRNAVEVQQYHFTHAIESREQSKLH